MNDIQPEISNKVFGINNITLYGENFLIEDIKI